MTHGASHYQADRYLLSLEYSLSLIQIFSINDNFYAPQCEGALAWDDPALKIDWKVPADKIILSGKDQHHEHLEEAGWLFDYNENLY